MTPAPTSTTTPALSSPVNVYADKGRREANAQPVSAMNASFPIDLEESQNIVAQAYAAMKQRPKFDRAKDV